MSGPILAHMSRPCCTFGGRPPARPWELFVAVGGNNVADWPEHTWPRRRGALIPSVAERAEALASLGFEPVDGADWSWQEYESEGHAHPPVVRLLASIEVRPLGEAGAVS